MHQYNPKILLVEDYEPNVLVATTWLEIFGYTYDVARTGSETIDKACATSYATILMDVQLPDIDGYEATQKIRAYELAHQKLRTPIIGMTARALAGDREKCINAGMDEYISKPIAENELRAKLLAIRPALVE